MHVCMSGKGETPPPPIPVITSNCTLVTVKPLMFACPLFREPNKTAKLKGANINCRQKIGWNYYSISNYMVLICQNKRGPNNFACKVADFQGSQIKGFYSTSWFIAK